MKIWELIRSLFRGEFFMSSVVDEEDQPEVQLPLTIEKIDELVQLLQVKERGVAYQASRELKTSVPSSQADLVVQKLLDVFGEIHVFCRTSRQAFRPADEDLGILTVFAKRASASIVPKLIEKSFSNLKDRNLKAAIWALEGDAIKVAVSELASIVRESSNLDTRKEALSLLVGPEKSKTRRKF